MRFESIGKGPGKSRAFLVPPIGLEPIRVSPLDPKSSASANFTTAASEGYFILKIARVSIQNAEARRSGVKADRIGDIAVRNGFSAIIFSPLSHFGFAIFTNDI